MGESRVFYAIGLDYGCEGKTAPLTLVEDRKLANSIRDIIKKAHGTSVYCEPVPVWPEVGPAGTKEGS